MINILIFFVLIFDYRGNSEYVKCIGPCIELSKCSRVQELIKKTEISPQICNFENNVPHVCCATDEESNLFKNINFELRVSKKRCKNFYPPNHRYAVAAYETERDEFPFMAVIGYGNNTDPVYNCGGFLVEKNFVITAGHCAKYNGSPAALVLIGGVPLWNNTNIPIRVIKVILHPEFNSDTNLNDIAVLVLGEQVKETPACLWSSDIAEFGHPSDVISAGYGSISFGGSFAKRLLKVYLTIVDNEVCKEEYTNQPIVDSQLCVEGKTRKLNENDTAIQDTCQGDSGGPLFFQDNITNAPYIVGIVSYGKGCGAKTPGIYTNINSYIDWIESVIWPGDSEEERIIFA